MKKLLLFSVALFALTFTLAAEEPVGVGVWFEVPENITAKNIRGVGIGLPIVANEATRGASLALCGNHNQYATGFQGTLFGYNYAKSFYGVQVSFLNVVKEQHGDFATQFGMVNLSEKNGVQFGFVNVGVDNATFQFGLVNVNHNGLLPIMIFVNFGKNFFN
ncbi:MAG: hypothetical protein MJ016_06520 [Victivallaceae bacterium]|nr:hypothetical protein [Victivallaceae bacterium]